MSSPHESLKNLIQFVREKSPFFKTFYKDVPDGANNLKQLPVIDQEKYWAANSLEGNQLLTGPMTDGLLLKSGGTTGTPKFSVFARDEWEEFTKTFANKLALGALKKGDRVANLFYVGDLYGSFIFTHKVLELCPTRVLQLPIAGITPMNTAAQTIFEYKATVVAGLPTSLMAFMTEVESSPRKYSVNTFLFAGEPLQQANRDRIFKVFPHAIIQSIGYASNDAGLLGYVDQSCKPNEFRGYDNEAIYEIVDEVTGLPISEMGQEGIALVTGLKRSLMPVIRYPVGDRAEWSEPLGTPDRKFVLRGRSEEAARVASLTIRFEDVQNILQKFSHKLGNFQFQLVSIVEKSQDGLIIRVACSISDAVMNFLEKELTESFELAHPIYSKFVKENKIRPLKIEWRNANQLEANSRTGKLKRVIDLRMK